MTELLPWLSFGAVLLSLALSGLSYVRAARWKDGEDASNLISRVGKAENDITSLKALTNSLATKEDVASIKSDVRALGLVIATTERGVERIEGYLMKERA